MYIIRKFLDLGLFYIFTSYQSVSKMSVPRSVPRFVPRGPMPQLQDAKLKFDYARMIYALYIDEQLFL